MMIPAEASSYRFIRNISLNYSFPLHIPGTLIKFRFAFDGSLRGAIGLLGIEAIFGRFLSREIIVFSLSEQERPFAAPTLRQLGTIDIDFDNIGIRKETLAVTRFDSSERLVVLLYNTSCTTEGSCELVQYAKFPFQVAQPINIRITEVTYFSHFSAVAVSEVFILVGVPNHKGTYTNCLALCGMVFLIDRETDEVTYLFNNESDLSTAVRLGYSVSFDLNTILSRAPSFIVGGCPSERSQSHRGDAVIVNNGGTYNFDITHVKDIVERSGRDSTRIGCSCAMFGRYAAVSGFHRQNDYGQVLLLEKRSRLGWFLVRVFPDDDLGDSRGDAFDYYGRHLAINREFLFIGSKNGLEIRSLQTFEVVGHESVFNPDLRAVGMHLAAGEESLIAAPTFAACRDCEVTEARLFANDPTPAPTESPTFSPSPLPTAAPSLEPSEGSTTNTAQLCHSLDAFPNLDVAVYMFFAVGVSSALVAIVLRCCSGVAYKRPQRFLANAVVPLCDGALDICFILQAHSLCEDIADVATYALVIFGISNLAVAAVMWQQYRSKVLNPVGEVDSTDTYRYDCSSFLLAVLSTVSSARIQAEFIYRLLATDNVYDPKENVCMKVSVGFDFVEGAFQLGLAVAALTYRGTDRAIPVVLIILGTLNLFWAIYEQIAKLETVSQDESLVDEDSESTNGGSPNEQSESPISGSFIEQPESSDNGSHDEQSAFLESRSSAKKPEGDIESVEVLQKMQEILDEIESTFAKPQVRQTMDSTLSRF